ncbi:LIP-domain-containing protein [Thozetella sp. PMI_491]|nr:LIP-domain-containing protein [Thozetella sp. PMI_491]
MQSLIPGLLLAGLAAAGAASQPSFAIWPTPAEPVLPAEDAFYVQKPDNLERYAPGALIRVRVAPGNLTALYNASAAYHLVYRTTNSLDAATWALTTLLVPPSNSTAASTTPAQFLSYQMAYNTAALNGAASYTLNDPAGVQAAADVTAALARGWLLAVPDFEGVQSAFLAGWLEGRAVLDGVRAVLQFSKQTPNKNKPTLGTVGVNCDTTRFALWGYSGGSLASGWAGELQATYAPELGSRFVGMAVGGMPLKVEDVLDNINGSPASGLIPEGLLGITALFPDARADLLARLRPSSAPAFLAALNMSISQAFVTYAGQNISDYFINGAADMYARSFTDLFASQAEMGSNGMAPRVPVFAYKSIGDEFSVVADSDNLVRTWCAAGTRVVYERNSVGGHLSEFQNGHSRALSFLEGRFAGAAVPDKCEVRNVTVVDPTGGYIGEDF